MSTARVSDRLRLRDGRLAIRTGKVDIGQRISTALVAIVAEELALPPGSIDVLPVNTADSPDEGITSGSNSVMQSGSAVGRAAATLRRHLLKEAARRHGGTPADWTLSEGMVRGPGSNAAIDVLELAAGIGLDMAVDPKAAPVARETVPSLPMRGMEALVTGRYRFVHDIEVPGMLHARVIRPPRPRAQLAGIDAGIKDRLEAEGFRIHRDGAFIAIAGPREWPAIRAAERLARACRWEGAPLPEGDIQDRLRQGAGLRLAVIDATPRADVPPPAPLEAPEHKARYERPYTLHGALAPSAALACWDGARLEITTHSQGIHALRESIAESLGLAPGQVGLTHAPGSGCYGHNGADDAAYEAALVAMALPGTPILLKWSREDEHAWEPFGPPGAVELAARTGADGRIEAFSAEAIGGTFRGRPRPGPDRAGPARLLANTYRATPIGPWRPEPNMGRQGGLQRNLDPAYDIPETRFVKALVGDLPLRSSALRCLGAALNVFAIESFMDELAHARGRDPVAFRLDHLRDMRGRALLDRVAAPAAPGRGIAYGRYKNEMARVAVRVDLEVGDDARIRLREVRLAVDAGRVADAAGLRAQIEGGFLQGASWALHEEVRWDRDGVLTRDWDSYPVLRFDEVPEIAVDILDRPDAPSVGAGEAATGPALAAIANAVFSATGLRLRRLPFTAEAIRRAALGA